MRHLRECDSDGEQKPDFRRLYTVTRCVLKVTMVIFVWLYSAESTVGIRRAHSTVRNAFKHDKPFVRSHVTSKNQREPFAKLKL